jgi:hypothetical protein
MPEITIAENGNALTREHQIGNAEHGARILAVAQSEPPSRAPQRNLMSRVRFAITLFRI